LLKAVPYLSDDKNANAKRLGVSNEQVNVFTAQQSAQDTVYSAYVDPISRCVLVACRFSCHKP